MGKPLLKLIFDDTSMLRLAYDDGHDNFQLEGPTGSSLPAGVALKAQLCHSDTADRIFKLDPPTHPAHANMSSLGK